jgi:tetratricopeptide (TPR) repeat protein
MSQPSSSPVGFTHTLDDTLNLLRRKMDNELKAGSELKGGKQIKGGDKANNAPKTKDEINASLTPAERALKYYERAKSLYTQGGGTSKELEIIIRDVSLASNFTEPDPKIFYFLAKVFREQLDFNSCIYALRNVIRIDPAVNRAARTMLGEVLFRRAKEVMGDAAIMDKQIQSVRDNQSRLWSQYKKDKAKAEEELAKQQAYKRQRKVQLALANKLRGTAAQGTVHIPPEIEFANVEIPPKPILLHVPKRVATYVADQYRLACGFFEECQEFDRDNFKAIMSKAVCQVYAADFSAATESITRAIHLANVRLKELSPQQKLRTTSAQAIDDAKSKQNKRIDMDDEIAKDVEDDPEVQSPNNLKPTSAAHLTSRNIYYSEFQHYETEDIAAEVKKVSRQVGEMLILRGKAYGAMGLTEKGNQDMRKANSIIPQHPECVKFGVRSYVRAEKIYNICLKTFKNGDVDEALKLICTAISLSTEDVKLYIMQARIYRLKEELEKAFQSIQKATELYQSHSEYEMRIPENIIKETNMIYNDIALECAGKGQYEKAILLLNKVITTESQLARNAHDIDYRFLLNRGDCHRAKQQYAQALLDYNASMSTLVSNKLGSSSGLEGARRQWVISTRLSITYYCVACNYFNESAFADAEHHLTLAIENNPKVAEYYLTRGKARYYSGSYQAAYDDFKYTLQIDPSNAEAAKRLKQFSSLNVLDNDADTAGRKDDFVGMTLAQAQNNPRAVAPIVPSSSDVIEAMLNPRSSKLLPDIIRSQSASNATVRRTLLPSKDARVISTAMLMPSLLKETSNKNSRHFQNISDSKYDTSKSIHWSMLANAQKMANARSRPPIDRKKTNGLSVLDMHAENAAGMTGVDFELESVESKGGTRRKVPKSYTAAGLKRYSNKQTLKSLQSGGLVEGVITHHNDPFLATVEAKKSKTFTIDVTSRPRVNKFVKQRPVEAGGEVQTFNSVNHYAEMVNNDDWRSRLADGIDMDLLAALTGGTASSFYDSPSSKTRAQREEEAVAARAAAKAERKQQRKAERAKRRAEKSQTEDDGGDDNDDDDDGDNIELSIGQRDRHGVIWLGQEYAEPRDGESDEDFQRRRELAAVFLSSTRMAQSSLASLLGGDVNFGDISAVLNDEGEMSSLIAMTEEQELQLAYEERIKSEHEEARRKKQERLQDKLQKQRDLTRLISGGEDEN